MFNCTAFWGPSNSIGLFVYNNIQEPPSNTPLSPNGTHIIANHTILPPSVEMCFPSRLVNVSGIWQYSICSQRDSVTPDSSIFSITPEPSIIHLFLSFYHYNPYDRSPHDAYDIFVSKSRLLEYITDRAPSTGGLKRIDWLDWMEHCTRWFRSEVIAGCLLSRWAVEGTRAIGTRYLERDGIGHNEFEYVTLLDFHPPTVRRPSNACDKHRSMSLWEGAEVRHIDRDSINETDLAALFEILGDREHGHDVFVDVVDENTPTFTKGFEDDTIVSRLPYRMVTRRIPRGQMLRWALGGDRIVGIQVSACPFSAQLITQFNTGMED